MLSSSKLYAEALPHLLSNPAFMREFSTHFQVFLADEKKSDLNPKEKIIVQPFVFPQVSTEKIIKPEEKVVNNEKKTKGNKFFNEKTIENAAAWGKENILKNPFFFFLMLRFLFVLEPEILDSILDKLPSKLRKRLSPFLAFFFSEKSIEKNASFWFFFAIENLMMLSHSVTFNKTIITLFGANKALEYKILIADLLALLIPSKISHSAFILEANLFKKRWNAEKAKMKAQNAQPIRPVGRVVFGPSAKGVGPTRSALMIFNAMHHKPKILGFIPQAELLLFFMALNIVKFGLRMANPLREIPNIRKGENVQPYLSGAAGTLTGAMSYYVLKNTVIKQ